MANHHYRIWYHLDFCPDDHFFGSDPEAREHGGCSRSNQPGQKPWRIGWNIVGDGSGDPRHPSAPGFAGWTPHAVRAPFRNQLATLQHSLAAQSGQAAQMQAYGVLYQTLQQQAGLWAYVDNFRLLALICLALVPIIFLFKKGKASPGAAAAAH